MEEKKEEGKPIFNAWKVLPIFLFIMVILAPLLYVDFLLSKQLQQVEFGVYAQSVQNKLGCPNASLTPSVSPSVTVTAAPLQKGAVQQGSPSGAIK